MQLYIPEPLNLGTRPQMGEPWLDTHDRRRKTSSMVLFACWESRKASMNLFEAVSEIVPLSTRLVIGIGDPVNTSLSSINARNTYTTISSTPVFINFNLDSFVFVPRKTVTARKWPFPDQFSFSDNVLLRIQHLEITMRRDDANFGSGI